jgi:hypothetical protein
MRHSPNFRKYARGRPHRLQRLCWRVENFGFFTRRWVCSVPSLTRFAIVAMFSFQLLAFSASSETLKH